ncbi:hypothetical protein DXG03_005373 [Asterophora parasitica]|uniref:V-SNARE coiled-coil homology domain-containing protein n=1 Tax=Asterophora parasitica TaxID=117018 RepID=A0A9P7FZY3_9AGAR|nr:hypothetical protein DXG03_005373 [Asterophora parasitica]
MPNYFRAPNTPFTLHGTAYDPPAPTVAPAPASSSASAPSSTSAPNTVPTGSSGARTAAVRGTGKPSRNASHAKGVGAVQAELDSTVTIMRENILSIAERGEGLRTLESRTENLAVSAREFRRSARKVRKDIWYVRLSRMQKLAVHVFIQSALDRWKDMKMRLIIGLAITVVVTLTVVSIVQALRRSKAKSQQQTQVNAQALKVPVAPGPTPTKSLATSNPVEATSSAVALSDSEDSGSLVRRMHLLASLQSLT